MKYKLLILLMFVGFAASAQLPGYTTINSRYYWLGGAFRALHIPAFGTTPSLQTGQSTMSGAVGIDSVLHRQFFYSGGAWRRLLSTLDTVSMLATQYDISSLSGENLATAALEADDDYIHNWKGFKLRMDSIGEFFLSSGNTSSPSGRYTDLGGQALSDGFNVYSQYDDNDFSGFGAQNNNGTSFSFLEANAGSTYNFFRHHPDSTRTPRRISYTHNIHGTFTPYSLVDKAFVDSVTSALGSGTPGGADMDVQINDNGSFYGESAFAYNKTTNTLGVTGIVQVTGVTDGSAVGPLIVKTTGTGVLGTALTLDVTSETSGQSWSFLNTGSTSSMGTGRMTYYTPAYGYVIAWNTQGETIITANGSTLTDAGAYRFQNPENSYFGGETQHEVQLKVKDISAPSTPASGYGLYYVNSDLPTFKDDGGNVFNFLGTDETQTISNKRITKRTGSVASSATPTINTDNVDQYHITALSVAITSFTTNLSGTPTEGQTLWITITDDGTPRTIAWGASFEASATALPTTTVASTRGDYGFVWNTVTSKWRIVASQ